MKSHPKTLGIKSYSSGLLLVGHRTLTMGKSIFTILPDSSIRYAEALSNKYLQNLAPAKSMVTYFAGFFRAAIGIFVFFTSRGASAIHGLPVSTRNSKGSGRRMQGALMVAVAEAIGSSNCLRILSGIFTKKHWMVL